MNNARSMLDIAMAATIFIIAITFSLQLSHDASGAISKVDRQNQVKDRNMSQTLQITQERIYTGADVIQSIRLLPSLSYEILIEGQLFDPNVDIEEISFANINPNKQYRLVEVRDEAGIIKRLAYQ